ncbi:MAG TPA: hypothetical protein VF905_02230, partial [Nitrospirota bacterium]
MDIIKGFALNRNFINNTPGVVADIGELSTVGWTFAKEPRVYSSQTYPTISLVHFPTIGSGVGTSASIPDDQKEHILKVIGNIYDKSASATIVFAPGAFIEYLIAQMGAEVADITCGGVITSGNRSIIEWIQWSNPAAAAGNVNKVWFSNNSFVGQADDYEITVIPPFLPPNQFFGQPAEVKYLLTNLSYSQEVDRIQTARGVSSETKLWGNTYNYINPVNKNDKTPAKFTCLLYGAAADNIDLIKEAIVQYLLANSTYTRDQWKNILPDLFMRTEFMIFPQWERMAVENVAGSTNGIFSPVIDLTAIMNKLVVESIDYDETHTRTNGQAMTFPYMSVAATSIGHIENRDGKLKLTDWYPDYFFASNTNADFNRMSLATQAWVLMIMEMLQIARAMTTSTTIPQGYSRVKRGTRL